MTAHDANDTNDANDSMVLPALSPPAKRVKYASEPTVSPRLLSSPSRQAAETLHAALASGAVVAFLSVEDASAALQSCRLLRHDRQLAAAWTRLVPDFKRLFPDEASALFRLRDHWASEAGPPAQAAQVVATAAFLKKRVAKWCFEFDPQRPDADDDLLCSVQPVLVPLAQFRVSEPVEEPAKLEGSAKWSRQPIKQALNAFCAGGGDAFFDVKSPAESRFAAHWDSVRVDRVSGRVACRLCDAVRDSLALYKRQVELGLRQFGHVLRHKQESWADKTPSEVEQLTTEFRAKYFPTDAYIRPECADWPDQRLLRHICDHGKLQAWPIGDTRAKGIASVDALLRAVSFKYQHQCRTFYQPLKKSLHGKCQVIGRIPHATLQNNARVLQTSDPNENERVLTELVGGVEIASGIFTGVQVTFRLRR